MDDDDELLDPDRRLVVHREDAAGGCYSASGDHRGCVMVNVCARCKMSSRSRGSLLKLDPYIPSN